ncbi:MAG: DUF2730 family protein [Sandarakinorhabdus sp.]|nr:DUF2730 family protein [Sandarakinorhabdus sp.]
MTTALALQAISVLSGIVALLCAIYVAQRANKWRDSDDNKLLQRKVGIMEGKVNIIESRLEHMATKTDVAAVQSDVRAIVREVGKVDDSVTRIETWLMERGK